MRGANARAVIQLRELPVTVTLRGRDASRLMLLDEVTVAVRGASPADLSVDMTVRKAAAPPAKQPAAPRN